MQGRVQPRKKQTGASWLQISVYSDNMPAKWTKTWIQSQIHCQGKFQSATAMWGSITGGIEQTEYYKSLN